MSKLRKIEGLFIIIVGGIITISLVVFAIIGVARELYSDLYSIEAKLGIGSYEIPAFSVVPDEELSIWLKIPDRKIENQDLVIEGVVRNNRGEEIGRFEENFSFGYLRNSFGEGQYYKLGRIEAESGFDGTIDYEISGEWIAPYDGKLVIRRKERSGLMTQIWGILGGLIIVAIGVREMNK